MKTNSKTIAIKQLFAFMIDITIVSFPLIVMTNMTGAFIFWFLWIFYIPIAEYFYSQTFGMRVLNTKIYANIDRYKLSFKTVLRRHFSRIGIVWGIVGWIWLFLGKQFSNDYVIVYKDFKSLDDSIDYSYIEEQDDRETFTDKLKSLFYAFVFFLVIIFVIFPIVHKIENSFDNSDIKQDFKKCSSTTYKKYKNRDEIAIAKCYDENKTLQYLNYYDLKGQLDNKYIFLDGKLDAYYDYITFHDGTNYLKYQTLGIQKTDKSYIEDGEKFYYYSGYRTKFDYTSKKALKVKKVFLNYREDKNSEYIDIRSK